MSICILVLKEEKEAYDFWENLKRDSTTIRDFQVIEPDSSKNKFLGTNTSPIKKVKFKDVKILNPKLSRKERQKNMSLWLMPFGFIAGLTFSGMTDLRTFSDLGVSKSWEPFFGGFLGMFSGWIGSFFAAGSVDSNQKDLKSLIQRNKEGFWLILIETPLEVELPWKIIKDINPIEIIILDVI